MIVAARLLGDDRSEGFVNFKIRGARRTRNGNTEDIRKVDIKMKVFHSNSQSSRGGSCLQLQMLFVNKKFSATDKKGRWFLFSKNGKITELQQNKCSGRTFFENKSCRGERLGERDLRDILLWCLFAATREVKIK